MYTLIKLKLGATHTLMEDRITNGSSRGWLYRFRFSIYHLVSRYYHMIGPGGLELWAPSFPIFVEAMKIKATYVCPY